MDSPLVISICFLLITSYFCIIYSSIYNTFSPDENALLLQFLAASVIFIYGITYNELLIWITGAVIWCCIVIIVFIIFKRRMSETYLNV